MRSLKEDLIAARAVIEKPEAWTKETFARDADGEDVEGWFSGATCWCALGAVRKVVGYVNAGDFNNVLWQRMVAMDRALELAIPVHDGVPEFNDAPETTHEDVLALFDRAIAAQAAPVSAAPAGTPDAN